jgi:hypothetical protein
MRQASLTGCSRFGCSRPSDRNLSLRSGGAAPELCRAVQSSASGRNRRMTPCSTTIAIERHCPRWGEWPGQLGPSGMISCLPAARDDALPPPCRASRSARPSRAAQLPRPACGERVGVRGDFSSSDKCGSCDNRGRAACCHVPVRRSPRVARRPSNPGGCEACPSPQPSPRKRGEGIDIRSEATPEIPSQKYCRGKAGCRLCQLSPSPRLRGEVPRIASIRASTSNTLAGSAIRTDCL